MFGLFYALATGVGAIVSGTKCAIQNMNGLSEGINAYKQGNNPTETYIDRKGSLRDIRTNKYVSIKSDNLSDSKDVYLYLDGEKTRNLSEEQRQREFEIGRQGNWRGRTADLYDDRWESKKRYGNTFAIQGSFYKDLLNEKLYVARKFRIPFIKEYDTPNGKIEMSKYKSCTFYMDIMTGKLVRKADTQIEDDKNPHLADRLLTDYEANKFMEDFNRDQDNGGWYQLQNKVTTNDPLKKKQYFFCNDYDTTDHTRSLYSLSKL